MPEQVQNFTELRVYQLAFELQQEVFKLSKLIPPDERYSLTSQCRRASRSVGANIAEAWQKRRYPAHFLSKLTDADGELAETEHWLDTALACEFITAKVHGTLTEKSRRVGQMLGAMMSKSDASCRDM